MLDPFKECPYLLLGLPPFATVDDINRKWKELVLINHPDKQNGSAISTVHTQALNCAKDRALEEVCSYAAVYARLKAPVDDEERGEEFARADAKRVLYERLWTEQVLGAGEREKSNAVEKVRMDAVRAANDAAESARMEAVRAANDARMRAENMGTERVVKKRRREHKKVWDTDEYKDLAVLVREFVQEKTEVQAEQYTSGQEFLRVFTEMHGMQDVDANFFYRKLKEAVGNVYSNTSVSAARKTGVMGYVGIRVRA